MAADSKTAIEYLVTTLTLGFVFFEMFRRQISDNVIMRTIPPRAGFGQCDSLDQQIRVDLWCYMMCQVVDRQTELQSFFICKKVRERSTNPATFPLIRRRGRRSVSDHRFCECLVAEARGK
jgi:hypothetical protein